MRRAFEIVGIVGILLFCGLIIWSTFNAIKPTKTIDVKVQPFKVRSTLLRPGEPILFESDACRYGKFEVVTYPTLKGNFLINLPPSFFVTSPGCTVFLNSTYYLPLSTPPGKYYLELTNLIKISRSRTDIITTRTEEFEVATPEAAL